MRLPYQKPFSLLTDSIWREYKQSVIIMTIIQSQPKKEVMAVDADDHLCRSFMFRFNFSEMRMPQSPVNLISARVTVLSTRHE
jgi:hypothetical protein